VHSVNRSREFARLATTRSAIFSCAELLFLFRIVSRMFALLPNSYVVTKQDRRSAYLRKGKPVIRTADDATRQKLTESDPFSADCTRHSLLSYLRTFPFSIRLDLSLSAFVV